MPLVHSRTQNAAVFCLFMLLAACGNAPERQAGPAQSTQQTSRQVAGTDPIKAALYAQYQEWRGTPYRYGGLSKNGIDCSGFVHLTLRQRFGSDIPRTTFDQARTGRPVSHGNWQAGDLVFFRTGPEKRHVGIYVEDGQFLHASSSEGVMLSNLSDHYWLARYWKAQRPSDRLAGR